MVATEPSRSTLAQLVNGSTYSLHEVPVQEIAGSSDLEIVIGPDGAESARAWVRPGPTVWLPDVFRTGSNNPPYDGGRFFLTFNRSVDAHRVRDILSLITKAGSRKVTLVGIGEAAGWVQLAAAISPVKVAVRLENPILDKLFIPGLARTGFPR